MASYKGIEKKWDLIKYALKNCLFRSVEIQLNSILGSLKVK